MKPAAARSFGFAAPVFLLVAAVAAYAGSLTGPFVFDDLDSIVNNPTIRELGSLGRVLSPPFAAGQTVGGRPVLNLSFALNYAVGGTSVEGYHAVNLLIHVLAGWALFGLARATFRRLGAAAAARADGLGFAVALLWLVHPLQTEAVTYVAQRAEALMGLFYLLTLYCFSRSAEEGGGRGWTILTVVCCLLGMGTKEVMVSAPVIVLLYDRAFVSGSFGAAWRRRRGLYLALAATWVPLAALVAAAHGRGGTSGGAVPVSWGGYVLTQGPAILHYLRLAVAPHPLIFDYGAEWVSARAAAPALIFVAALVIATGIGLGRNTAWGFLGAFFFAVLAPTSLVPGIRQTLAEHRMYLALAPLLALAVAGVGLWPGWSGRSSARAGAAALFTVGALFAWLTERRNADYRSDLALWSVTVAERPDNPYAHNDLGFALQAVGRKPEAAGEFETALRLKPDLPEADNNLGNIRRDEGRRPEAVALYRRALSLRPRYAEADNNLGVAETALGNFAEAIDDFARALRINPDYVEARYNLGIALADARRYPEAVGAYKVVLEARPAFVEARLNLAIALAQCGLTDLAIAEFRQVLKERPEYADGHFDLANALTAAGQLTEAAAEYRETLRLEPGNAAARGRLERVEAALAPGVPAP